MGTPSRGAQGGGAKRQLPSVDAPHAGRITVGGVTLTEALYFVEDGDHVLRSAEFDVYAAGGSLNEAVLRLGRGVLEYMSELQEVDDPTEDELVARAQLTRRAFEIIERNGLHPSRRSLSQRLSQAARDFLRPDDGGTQWQPRGDLGTTRTLSHA